MWEYFQGFCVGWFIGDVIRMVWNILTETFGH